MNNKRSLGCLNKLRIERVEKLRYIPQELSECTSLQTLSIKGCRKLTTLPENLSNLVSLEVLEIKNCPNLVSPPDLTNLGSLRELISNSWMGVPSGLQSCKSLELLEIEGCEKVRTLPDLAGLSRLSNLSIRGMTKMIRQPPDWLLCSLSCLRTLHIGYYSELEEFPDLCPLLRITSLQELYLYGWEKLECIPEQLQNFTNLTTLVIVDFSYIEHLPDWFQNLSSLQQLALGRCTKLKKLPSKDAMKLLNKLNYLMMKDCPLLEDAINKNGCEHHKIAAACIHVDIQNSTND